MRIFESARQGKTTFYTMTKVFKSFTFLLFVSTAFGQYTICDCCTYSSFQNEETFENQFNPEIIKNNKIKELTIYTTSKQISDKPKDTTFKIVDKEYKEMILRFNASGFVEAQILFNRLGQYHSINEFTRDGNNKILSKSFHYLDSVGKKDEEFLVDKWVYTYSNKLLKQKKKLDDKHTIQPDTKSSFESYEYDSNGRVITETRNTYYEGSESFFYQTKVKYNDTTKSSNAITRDKKKLFSTIKTIYYSNQKPLTVKFIDGRKNKTLEEKIFTYTTNGQLLKLEVKNSGMGTECPDGGNFSDTYIYSSLNLIDNIKHNYKKTVCSLRFVYK
jgi:hypothetical protein